MNSNEILFRKILNLKFLHVFFYKNFVEPKYFYTFAIRNLKNNK